MKWGWACRGCVGVEGLSEAMRFRRPARDYKRIPTFDRPDLARSRACLGTEATGQHVAGQHIGLPHRLVRRIGEIVDAAGAEQAPCT